MTRIRNHRTMALIIAAALLVVGVAASASALTKITLKAGNLEATFEGGISPTVLPKHGSAGVALTLNGKIKSTDGSHLAAVDTITLEFDKAGSLNTKGLGTCKASQLESRTTADAEKACKSAIVGKGNVTADIKLPEQNAFGASGPLIVFNASKGNKQELLLHVYAHVPAATTFVVPVKISKAHGKYGTKAFIKVPKIVSGAGSVTSFKGKLKKTWNYQGKKQNLLNASCPRSSLSVHGEFKFVGGTKFDGVITVPCTGKG